MRSALGWTSQRMAGTLRLLIAHFLVGSASALRHPHVAARCPYPWLALVRFACNSARCFSDHRQSACNGSIKVRPNLVSEYSTFGGTTGWTLRCTRPSRSRLRKVCVSIFCEIPPIARCSSA